MTQNDIDPYGNTETVSLSEFLSRDSKGQEYIRLIPDPDNREIHLFRNTARNSGEGMIKTVIEGTFKVRGTRDREINTEFLWLNFHYSDVSTILTFLNSLKWDSSRSPANLSVEYWPINNSPMLDNNDMIQETISFAYRTESGNSHRVELSNIYEEKQFDTYHGKPTSAFPTWD